MSLQAKCPACGGDIEWKLGDSLVVVCSYCHSAIARADRQLSDLGKVADLADTGSQLRLGLAGSWKNVRFTLVGHGQMAHPQGGTWDEWYVHFSDGRWGWLAEAQGQLYLTFRGHAPALPAYDELVVGEKVFDEFIAAEKSHARALGAEGEMPFEWRRDAEWNFCDLSGPSGVTGTLDYSEAPPIFFVGRTVTLAELGIVGPFVLANLANGPARSNLGGILDAYVKLPERLRAGHQLVIAGVIDDPWAVVAYLHDRHCAEGLVLVGPVDQPTLRTLYGRCAVFVSPGTDQGPPLSLVEAMGCGAAVVAGLDRAQAEVIGDAGLFADPSDPAEIAERVSSLLVDPEMARYLGRQARARSLGWTWGPVVEGFLAALGLDEFEAKAARRKPSPSFSPEDRTPALAIAAGPRSHGSRALAVPPRPGLTPPNVVV